MENIGSNYIYSVKVYYKLYMLIMVMSGLSTVHTCHYIIMNTGCNLIIQVYKVNSNVCW